MPTCVRTEKIPLYTQRRPGEAALCAFRLDSESSAGKGKPRAVTGSPISRTCLQSQLYFWNNPMGFNFFRKLKRNPARPVFSLIVPDPDKPSLLLPVPPLPSQRPDCGECVTWPPSFRASRGIPYTPRTRGWGAAQRLHPEGDRVSLISGRGPSSADTSSQCVHAQWLRSVRRFAAPWTASRRAPLTGIFQARILEHGAISSPGDLSDPGVEPAFLSSPALAGGFFTPSATWSVPTRPEMLPESQTVRVSFC